jgi:hypothetical protein
MKLPLKTKKIASICIEESSSPKTILLGGIGMEAVSVFCHQDEMIKYLFFECCFARSIWSIIQVASNLYPLTSVANIFGNWLHGIDLMFRTLIRVGALAVVWSLWLCRNDKIFIDKNSSLLQVISRCAGILRLWSPLEWMDHHDLFTEVCTRLEVTARDTFSLHGWPHNLRIAPPPSP